MTSVPNRGTAANDTPPGALPEWLTQSLRCPRTGAELVAETNSAGEVELVTPAGVEPQYRYQVESGVPILLP